jgi:hypothetical protein
VASRVHLLHLLVFHLLVSQMDLRRRATVGFEHVCVQDRPLKRPPFPSDQWAGQVSNLRPWD